MFVVILFRNWIVVKFNYKRRQRNQTVTGKIVLKLYIDIKVINNNYSQSEYLVGEEEKRTREHKE